MPFEDQGELPPREDRTPIPANWDDFVVAAKRWLEYHWGGATCPYCNGDTWRINEVVSLVSAPEMWPISSTSIRGYYAALPIICAKCGHMVLINAFYIFRIP